MSKIPVDRDIIYTAHPYTEGYQESDHTVTWIFSDGTTATGLSVTKQWTEPGFHTASCRAVNNITKKWSIANSHCNAEYLDPGDIIIVANVPDTVAMLEYFDISAIASRDINPVNGYSYNWVFTGTVDDKYELGAEKTLRAYYAQTYDWTLTVTDLDVLDTASVSGTMTITASDIWGYTDASNVQTENSGNYVAPDGWIYFKNTNKLYKYLPFDSSTLVLAYTAPLEGNETVNIPIVGSKGKILFTSRKTITEAYEGSSQMVDKWIQYYYVYDTSTGTCNKRLFSNIFQDYYQWYDGNLASVSEPSAPQYVRYSMFDTTPFVANLTLLDDDTIDIGLHHSQTDSIYTDQAPAGKGSEDTFHSNAKWECCNHFKYHIADDSLVSPINDGIGFGADVYAHNGHVTYFPSNQYQTGSVTNNLLGYLATSDIDGSYWSRPYTLNHFMGGTPTEVLGGSQGSKWYIGTKIPIQNDNRFFIFVFADDPNTAPYSETFGKCFLVDPTSNELMTEWTNYEITNIPVIENPYVPGQYSNPVYRMQTIKWQIIHGAVVGFPVRPTLNQFPYDTEYLFSAVIDPNTLHLNVVALDNTCSCNPSGQYVPHGRTADWVYHPILDRIFTESAAIHVFSQDGFPRMPYNEAPETEIMTISYKSSITGDNSIGASSTKLYHCANSLSTETKGVHCEWSVIGKATLLEPSAGEVQYNAPEFNIKVLTNPDFTTGDTLTLQARIYTHGGEVIKTKTLNFYDPMSYYAPITSIAYGETKAVIVPKTAQVHPKDPTRSRMCALLEFTGTAGDEISVSSIAPGAWDTYMIMYNNSMALLSQDDDSAGNYNSRITRELLYTGKYYVSVMGYSDSSSARTANVTLLKTN